MDIDAELKRFCELMIEHCESVRVIVTTHGGGQTQAHSCGAGNWYAQKASVDEWIQRGIQQDQAQFIADCMEPPEDSDSWKSQ